MIRMLYFTYTERMITTPNSSKKKKTKCMISHINGLGVRLNNEFNNF
jgi:hypothetical protein